MTLWTIACQSPPSLGFSRQEYWSGLPCPHPEDLPNHGITLASLISLRRQASSLPLVPPGKPKGSIKTHKIQGCLGPCVPGTIQCKYTDRPGTEVTYRRWTQKLCMRWGSPDPPEMLTRNPRGHTHTPGTWHTQQQQYTAGGFLQEFAQVPSYTSHQYTQCWPAMATSTGRKKSLQNSLWC